MSNFGLVVIGAHHGFWLENEVLKVTKDVLLVEPVDYNYLLLKKRFSVLKNIFFDKTFISAKDGDKINFYYVKENSIQKLGKHWASGLGSFSKDLILSHRSKRFKITENDLELKTIEGVSFNSLCKRYKISSIDKLIIDIEGSEKAVLKTINYEEFKISKIQFEFKHLDGYLNYKNSLDDLILFFNSKNYKEIERDQENITFYKL
jgi:FkbM family methyltransferase